MSAEAIVVDVRGCARCDGDHDQLRFDLLGNPVELGISDPLTHWAACPETGEPILMRAAEH